MYEVKKEDLIGYTVNEVHYEFISHEEVIVAGCGLYEIKDLDIPDKVEILKSVYTVVGIKEKAFYRNKYVDMLLLPPTIKFVGKSAFAESGVRHILFSNTLRAHEVKFEESICYECTRLKTIDLPNGLREIPDFAFVNNVSLEEVDIPWRLRRIGDMAFYQCSKLKYFDFLPNIEDIGSSSFQGTNLHYAEIGNNVKHVGSLAFAHIENLHVLAIDTWEIEVEEKFILNEQVINIYLADDERLHEQIDLKLDIEDHHKLIYYNQHIWQEDGIKYVWMKDKTARIIGYSERELKPSLFLEERVGPGPVTSFEKGFLNYSKKIKDIVFPNKINGINESVFEDCENLRSVTFNHDISEEDSKRIIGNKDVKIYYHYKENKL